MQPATHEKFQFVEWIVNDAENLFVLRLCKTT